MSNAVLSFQSDLSSSSPSSAGSVSCTGRRGEPLLSLVASVVCGSGLDEDPSVCGGAVCVQLMGARTRAGCRGQKQVSI